MFLLQGPSKSTKNRRRDGTQTERNKEKNLGIFGIKRLHQFKQGRGK